MPVNRRLLEHKLNACGDTTWLYIQKDVNEIIGDGGFKDAPTKRANL